MPVQTAEDERRSRANHAMERRRDADLVAFNAAKVHAQGFLELYQDRTLTFPLLSEAKGALQNLQIAASQLEIDSRELLSKISDSDIQAEECAFLEQNLLESGVITNQLSNFIEGWETDLMSDRFEHPPLPDEDTSPGVDTPMRRSRAQATAAPPQQENILAASVPPTPLNRLPSILLGAKSAPRQSVYDTPLRRRRLNVSSTPREQVLKTPLAVRRSQRPEPTEHSDSVCQTQLSADVKRKSMLNSNAKEFVYKIPNQMENLTSPPNPERTHQLLLQQSRNQLADATLTRTRVDPTSYDSKTQTVHSPSCQDCKTARTKFQILKLKVGLARDLVVSPSEKSDRDRVKDQMNRLLSEIERFADEDVFYLISDAHAMVAEVTTMFAQFDSDQKAVLSEIASRSVDKKSSSATRSHVNFKPLAVPKFDDTFRGYAEFKSRFTSLVSDHMDEQLALLRLKEECLTPKSVAHQLCRAKTCLEDVWLALDSHFGRASVVKDAVLRDLQELKQIKSPTDVKGLRELLVAIITAKEDLDRANMSHALGDSAFSILMTKIPYQIRTKIDGRIYDAKPMPSQGEQVNIYLSVLERETAIQETHSIRTQAHVPRSPPKEKKGRYDGKQHKPHDPSLHVQSLGETGAEGKSDKQDRDRRNQEGKSQSRGKGPNNGSRPRYCSFHPGSTNHATLYCPSIVNLSSQELEAKIALNKLCRLCFGSHPTRDCRSTRSCPEPNCPNPKNHNMLLHAAVVSKVKERKAPSGGAKPPGAPPAPSKPELTAPTQNTSSQSTVSSADFLDRKPGSVVERDEFNSYLGFNTIRPSHTAFLKGKSGEFFPISVLYDVGGDLTQVTKAVVSKSSSVPFNSLPNLRISAAGDQSPKDWGKADLYDLPVYDDIGNCVMNVKCVSVDTIGYMKPADVNEVSKIFESRGHDVSDVLQPAQGCIDLLIGCNYANHQPQPIESIETVSIANTRFGKLLYGAHPSFPPDSEHLAEPSSCLFSVSTDHSAILQDQHDSENASDPSDPVSSTSNSTAFVSCCPCVYIATTATLSKSERDFFDRMIAVDDQVSCVKCQKCLTDSDIEKNAQIAMYRKCLTYSSEKQAFITKMPWIQDFSNLPDNKEAALKRLFSLTKSYARNEHMKNWYVSEFEKLIEKGILVEVSDDESAAWSAAGNKVWYVAHFPVLNETSESTPLRVVFDPTLKFKGILIDRLWERPPNMIPSIPNLLLRFREHYVPVTCDVSKAYWSLFLETPESHLHRVVWNKLDPDQPARVFRMVRNSWGMSPSGSLCSIAMLVTAEKHREDFPHVYEFIKSNLYVDDGAFSVPDVRTAIKLARDTCHVMSKGGFVLKHFTIGGVPYESTSTEMSDFADLPQQVKFAEDLERILGILWDPKDDTLKFPCRVNFTKRSRGARQGPDTTEENFESEFPDPLTLRQFTSVVYTHFDPQGLTTPVSIMMRHEMGLLCLLGGDWDDPIPHENSSDNLPTNYERCKIILRYLYALAKTSFTRCLRPLDILDDANPVLVIFSDMSLLACGTCIYYNWMTPSGVRVSRLAASKAKPCPKRPPLLTVPRGECTAAVMAVNLADQICKNSTYEFERRIFLLDSTIVLSQIANDPTGFNSWVCSRISVIQSLADPSEFYHIESALNIADDTTRGLEPDMLGLDSRWQNGESFMSLPIEEWPMKSCAEVACKVGTSKDDDNAMEVRNRDPRMSINRGASNLNFSTTTEIPEPFLSTRSRIISWLLQLEIVDLDSSESWIRARRRVARIVRFLQNVVTFMNSPKTDVFKTRLATFQSLQASQVSAWISENDQFCPTQSEMSIAAFYWITRYQKGISQQLLKSIKALNPIKSTDGLWRLHGRTSVVQKPPILVPTSTLANVLLRSFHVPTHCGAHTTLANVRQHFWIVKGAVLANALVAKCSRCKTLRKEPYQVVMAPLKLSQCQRSQVFETIALDLCGPFFTKADRRSTRQVSAVSGKVWIMVLVCAASRAVHLELCDGYSTPDVLNALKSFTDLRGFPTRIYADRGTQLVGASNVTVKLWENVDVTKITNSLCPTTEWEFVPSGAHSFLGMAERLVASVKQTMDAVYYSKQPRLTKLEFYRMLFSISNLINSRPLAIRSNRASKLEDTLLRPNDLLLGRSSSDLGPIVDPLAEHPTKYNHLLRQKESFLHDFWQKWYKVVFQTLMTRGKWLSSGRPVSVGDIVLIRDTNPIRGHWSWGEVFEIHHSLDNQPRRVSVRYKSLTPCDGKPTLPRTRSKYVVKSVRDLCPIMTVEDRTDKV